MTPGSPFLLPTVLPPLQESERVNIPGFQKRGRGSSVLPSAVNVVDDLGEEPKTREDVAGKFEMVISESVVSSANIVEACRARLHVRRPLGDRPCGFKSLFAPVSATSLSLSTVEMTQQ